MSTVHEDTKLTLPAGDPQAGHTTHDTSPVFGTGTLPDVEQEIYDEREKAREEQVKAIGEAEDKVARERQADADKEEKKRIAASGDEGEKGTAKSSTSKSSSS